MSDEEISLMKKEKFKNLVNSRIKVLSTEYLENLKNSHSKSKNIYLSEEIKDYLVDEEITVEEQKLLFLLRWRMFPVKSNLKNNHEDLLCSLCSKCEEEQSHLLECEEIVKSDELCNMMGRSVVKYKDIYGPISKQKEAIRIWKLIEKVRKWKLKEKENEIE